MNFICMCKVCIAFKNHVITVLSLLHVACTCLSIIFEVYLWLCDCSLVPSSVTGISGEPTALEGNNLQLTCEASGRPEPNITWTKEKPGNQDNIGVVQEGKVLNITNINRNDSGTFTCTAYNGFGKKENLAVHVNVTCEYALKKTLTNVKQRCTFHIFSVL